MIRYPEKETLEFIAKELVDLPDEVRVKLVEERVTSDLYLKVDPSDRTKIIGERGKMEQAILTVLQAVGRKHGRSVTLTVE
jgi:predicted RNA-binding protein YlqC (UPF0109 family)